LRIIKRENTSVYYGKESVIMNGKTVKIIGILASIAGFAATMAGNWASEKQQDAKIAEEVAKALKNQMKES
jgi:hypothetical protein